MRDPTLTILLAEIAMAEGRTETRTSKILSFIDDVKRAVHSLKLKNTFDWNSPGTHCVVCKQELEPEKKGCQFCSQRCAADYWEGLRRKHTFTSAKGRLCKMPGCTNLCFVESDGRIHDFCGRTHAKDYLNVTEEIKRENMRKSWSKRYSDRSSSGEGSSYATAAASGGPSHTRSGAVYGPTTMSQQRDFGSSHRKDNSSGPIRFYDRDAPYYEFTNFYAADIHLDDKIWPTTEHYFQAQKFVGTPFAEMIRRCAFPREAFDLSRNPTVSRWRRSDWDEVKIDVMRKALLAKFTQHERLLKILLSTKNRQLIEHTSRDSFWGNGGDDTGQNHLGRLLMEIRDNIRKSTSNKAEGSVQHDGASGGGKDHSGFHSQSPDSVNRMPSNDLPRRPLREGQQLVYTGPLPTPVGAVPVGVVPVGTLVDVSIPAVGNSALIVGGSGVVAVRPDISGPMFSHNDFV